MTAFLQRQISSMMIPGSSTDPGAKPYSARLLDQADTYPGNVLQLGDGDTRFATITVAASGSQVITLPENYVSTRLLGAIITSDQDFRLVTVSPDNPTSTLLANAGASTDEEAAVSWVGTVTSITLTNVSAVVSKVRVALFMYPADITLAAAWRSGYQTVGA